jgi:hypothetical protein
MRRTRASQSMPRRQGCCTYETVCSIRATHCQCVKQSS